MKTYIQLLYKTFYDTAFVRNYVKNGKGSGTGLLAFVAMIMSLITLLSFVYLVFPLYNTENVKTVIMEQTAKLPDLTIVDGELAIEEEAYYEFKLSDLSNEIADELTQAENLTILTINTFDNEPAAKDIKNSLLYLTKTDFYVSDLDKKMEKMSLKNIQQTFEKNPFNPVSEENITSVITISQKMLKFFLIALFVFSFIFDWLANVILAIITRFFVSISNKDADNINPYEKRRAAAAAIIPALLIIVILQAIFAVPGSLLKWIAVTVTGIILMSRYLFKDEKDTENKES